MESNVEMVVYFVILLGIASMVFGLVGLVRKKISIHYRNHVWEGKGAVLVSMIFFITGFGLLLSIIL